ncbi:MAG: peptidylprolyl isomerase [Verrucomicrobia bacterium]|jgi:peptidyl-prolyl cis-trans isomerase A (cyclophilin A)|nr:peptidylprolyl isomerase [Verrucomicrobiota bacterium]|tara:strand:+ start:1240 stop:2508 length:1269 start_codon:yes stop_codon:yes gene_type:complete
MRALLSFFIVLTSSVNAQIYADFTVSSGGNSLGTFTVTLEHEKAPRTCANFIRLATGKRPWIDVTNGAIRTNTPYYDGLTFHRLVHNFVIQGGSPNGQGTDGPGYSFLDEYHPDLRHSSQYVLSMAKGGFPNTGGSQFFITLRATPELDDKHSIFGMVTSGTAIIDGFKNSTTYPTDRSTNTDPNANPNSFNDKPFTPIIMDSVVIYGPDADSFDFDDSSLRLPTVSNVPYSAKRDTIAKTFGIRFKRAAKANHFILISTNLQQWFQPQHLLSVEVEEDFDYTFTNVDIPSAFIAMASVSYEQIPLAPQTMTELHIHQSDTFYIDLVLNGNEGTWTGSDNSSGTLSNVSYGSDAPASGHIQLNNLEADRFPLGNLSLTFSAPAGPEAWTSLNTFLSFHTETSGWLEEKQGTARRRPFEILSN